MVCKILWGPGRVHGNGLPKVAGLVLTLNTFATAMAGSKPHGWRWLVWASGAFLAFSPWFTGKVSLNSKLLSLQIIFPLLEESKELWVIVFRNCCYAVYLKLISKLSYIFKRKTTCSLKVGIEIISFLHGSSVHMKFCKLCILFHKITIFITRGK